jgi:alpha-amylase/alpha-mannosidase (GH57 family)
MWAQEDCAFAQIIEPSNSYLARWEQCMECLACIHCHFYQPPRENPWLEAVEAQDSASPDHDWNARIARECYLANGWARILDGDGRISKIVNNYARISFNFGPTLLSWMEEREPEGYRRILEGDRESQRIFSGHGSALAQAYNHTILPLANRRDKRTQIRWGMQDFQRRFERDPEGIWLPETAVDLETLELLSAEGIKFTVLAPSQAAQLRIGKKAPWIQLEYGVDSRHAYVCRLPSGREIALFFYDGGISTAVAFERLLFSGENFARTLLKRFDPEGDSGQLMHVATDGETYGHHHAHGDMALAYALHYIEENRMARITNYGEYLQLHPPTQEVRIKEETSWSCAHGVGRWNSNCGCNSGGRRQWNQNWRQPLRDAFDWLRDDLALPYVREARKLLSDPWLARDEYIKVVNDRSAANIEDFFAKHRTHQLCHDEEVQALRLLEMQRHLMLMYTSCGWFFDEPTGPETIQILQYAGRAVQLGEQLFGGQREEEFLERLEAVHSNIPEFGNGRQIYKMFVTSAMLDLPGGAAHYAISSFFDGYRKSESTYSYQADLHNVQFFEHGRLKLAWGSASIVSRITHAQLDFNFAVLHGGGHNLRAGICQLDETFPHFIAQLQPVMALSGFDECSSQFDRYFGPDTYSLKSLFCDERRRIVGQLVDSTLADIDQLYADVCEHNTALIGFLQEVGMPLPPILRVSCEFALNNDLQRCLREGKDLSVARTILNTAAQHGIAIDASIKSTLRERLNDWMERWSKDPLKLEHLVLLDDLAFLMRQPPFEADLWKAQNTFYELLAAVTSLGPAEVSPEWLSHFRALGTSLDIAMPEPLPAFWSSQETTAPASEGFPPPSMKEKSASVDARS